METGELNILPTQKASGLRLQNTAFKNICLSIGDMAGKEEK